MVDMDKGGNPEKLDSTVHRLSKKLIKGIAAGAVSVALIAGAFNGVTRYNRWVNEPIYREDLSAVVPRNFDPALAKDANRILLGFPTQIPGASRVDKYMTLDAKRLVVNIRQTHYPPEDEITDYTPEQLEMVKKVQESIYSILSYLKQTSIYDNIDGRLPVYNEGVLNLPITLEQAQSRLNTIDTYIDECIAKISSQSDDGSVPWEKYGNDEGDLVSGNFTDADICRRKYAETIEQLNGIIEYFHALHQKSPDGKYAVDRLVYEGKVEELGAEKISGVLLSEASIAMGLISSYTILESREDAFLEIIQEHDLEIAIIVLGGMHEFGGTESFGDQYRLNSIAKNHALPTYENSDNIARWNAENPDKKISLIEITPEHYEQP